MLYVFKNALAFIFHTLLLSYPVSSPILFFHPHFLFPLFPFLKQDFKQYLHFTPLQPWPPRKINQVRKREASATTSDCAPLGATKNNWLTHTLLVPWRCLLTNTGGKQGWWQRLLFHSPDHRHQWWFVQRLEIGSMMIVWRWGCGKEVEGRGGYSKDGQEDGQEGEKTEEELENLRLQKDFKCILIFCWFLYIFLDFFWDKCQVYFRWVVF